MEQVTALLTSQEVADRLAVTRPTVNDWTRAGRLSAITLPSGRKRYRLADIEAIEAGDTP
jgi:excisionase family DNA binding protein